MSPSRTVDPTAWLRQRWARWWQARHPPSDHITLTQRNVYILPSGAGCLFAALLAVLLVASINYQLNLGYLLTFLLAGVGLSSMQATHATLRGLRLSLRLGEPVFAGEAVSLHILAADGESATTKRPVAADASTRRLWQRTRHGIGLRLDVNAKASTTPPQQSIWLDVPAGGNTATELRLTLPTRGVHSLPRLLIETRFPFGLFRAWSYWRPASTALAWPLPEQPTPALPWQAAADGRPATPTHGLGDEPDGARPYRRGDSLTQVLWKKSAQAMASGGELVSRDRAPRARGQLSLHWDDAALPQPEQRLSRLAAWVVAAEQAGTPHDLKLPQLTIEPGEGSLHRRRCLDALARWGQGSS